MVLHIGATGDPPRRENQRSWNLSQDCSLADFQVMPVISDMWAC